MAAPEGSYAQFSLVCDGTLTPASLERLGGCKVRFDTLDPFSKPEAPTYTPSELFRLGDLGGRTVVKVDAYDFQSLSLNFLKPGFSNPSIGAEPWKPATCVEQSPRSVAFVSAVFVNDRGEKKHQVNYPLGDTFFSTREKALVRKFDESETEVSHRVSKVVALTLTINPEMNFRDLEPLADSHDGTASSRYVSSSELSLRHFHYQDPSPEKPTVFPLRCAFKIVPTGLWYPREDIEWGDTFFYHTDPQTGEQDGPHRDAEKGKEKGVFVRSFAEEKPLPFGPGAKPCIDFKSFHKDAFPLFVEVDGPEALKGFLTARVELPVDRHHDTEAKLKLQAGKTYSLGSADWVKEHNTRGREVLHVDFQYRSDQSGEYGEPIGKAQTIYFDLAAKEALKRAEWPWSYSTLESLRLRVSVSASGITGVKSSGAVPESTCDAITRLVYKKPAPFHYGETRLDLSDMRGADAEKRTKLD